MHPFAYGLVVGESVGVGEFHKYKVGFGETGASCYNFQLKLLS